ncbi:outer membrane lipoprotein [Massilia endophytica]|uniref:glycine zipper 2TM domain-containing protein n=1 Tax=Massilia endophytica TaxID=2899220 RepID=UPI001E535677|nr:glycine zipper 2TM domain-containing protein [Massilia endophytica]UGQ47845.1 glycine zipper 2TM domain-containing protein [Massilia endophytica]
MDNPITSTRKHNTHPVLLIAAIAVILFCTVGIAAVMGWLPSSMGERPSAESLAVSSAPATTPAYPPPSAAVNNSQYGATMPADAIGGGAVGAAAGVAAPRPEPRPEPRDEAPVRAAAPAPVCKNCGVVEHVNVVTQRASGSGVGAAGGAVVGGLLGHQVGDGRGRDLATIAGAIGGAVVGNQVEGNMKATKSYDVTVRMNNGSTRTIHTTSAQWQQGDRVRIVNGQLRAR